MGKLAIRNIQDYPGPQTNAPVDDVRVATDVVSSLQWQPRHKVSHVLIEFPAIETVTDAKIVFGKGVNISFDILASSDEANWQTAFAASGVTGDGRTQEVFTFTKPAVARFMRIANLKYTGSLSVVSLEFFGNTDPSTPPLPEFQAANKKHHGGSKKKGKGTGTGKKHNPIVQPRKPKARGGKKVTKIKNPWGDSDFSSD